MRVLLIGSGSKEHALVWKLQSSPKYQDMEIIVAPGNAALERLVEVLDIDINDIDRLLEIAIARNVNLTIVGEPQLFAKGIVDRFREAGKLILGPTQAASEIEWSNAFAKNFLFENNIACPRFVAFDNLNLALAFINSVNFPVKISANYKFNYSEPYFIAHDYREARRLLKELFKPKFLSRETNTVIIEECIEGHRFTLNTLCDGDRALSLPPVQAYRGIDSEDMGAYAPTPILTESLMQRIRYEIINPTIEALAKTAPKQEDANHWSPASKDNRSYTGILAFDIMLDTADGLKPKLLEYRSCLADSDAQVILPLLDEDLYEVLAASAAGDLSFFREGFHRFLGSALAVNIVANDEFSDFGETQQSMVMLENLNEELQSMTGILNGVPLVFYGTKSTNSQESFRSEIFGATAVAENLLDAQILAYKLAESLSLPSKQFERNIGDQGMI